MTTATFEQTLVAARRLSPQERARLIAQLATELVAPADTATHVSATNDAWAQMQQFRQEFSELYPNARLAARLEADRQEREEGLRNGSRSDDVHA